MKRYSHFLRSGATVSLSILYLATSLFSYTFVGAQEVSQNVQNMDESSSVVETSGISLEESEVIFSEQVDPHEKTISEQTEEILIEEQTEEIFVEVITQIEEETKAEEISTEVFAPEVFTCDETNTPEISFAKTYADAHISDLSMESSILSQLNPTANDPQDGSLVVSNDVALNPLTTGWNEITFSATDSTDCVTTSVISVFVAGDNFAPVCQSGFVYAKITFPENLTASLGTNTSVQSGEWFPVMIDGSTFSESKANITTNPDIAIVRAGTMVLIDVASTEDDDGMFTVSQISDSIEFSGGSVLLKEGPFSSAAVSIMFQSEDCPVDVCTAFGGPSIVSITSTVTIDENTTLTEDEIFTLFGVTAEDLDGEGLVTITSNLSLVSFQNEGVYTITITLTDNEGCVSSQTVTLVVEGEDDNGGGGGKRSGSKKTPEGEVLGATTCEPYLTTYMQMGQANLKSDVEKLQIFLNEYMGENLKVDGVYGKATFEAVKRFQTQEFNEILKPWGITDPTGITRETTVRRINNIMCPELNIQMPILYCATTGNLIYPDGTVVDPDPEYILYNGRPVIRKQVITSEVYSESETPVQQSNKDTNYSWVPAPVINPETGRKYEK